MISVRRFARFAVPVAVFGMVLAGSAGVASAGPATTAPAMHRASAYPAICVLYKGLAPSPLPVIRLGSRGFAVSYAQCIIASDFVNIDVDGIFGPQTDKGVRYAQKRCGIKVDGIVGPITWKALESGKC